MCEDGDGSDKRIHALIATKCEVLYPRGACYCVVATAVLQAVCSMIYISLESVQGRDSDPLIALLAPD